MFNIIKTIHILSAALLLTSMVYSIWLWRYEMNSLIQKQTLIFIMPLALFQLVTGFMMISLQHAVYATFWVMGNMTGFLIVILSWFMFIYLVLTLQYRRIQLGLLILCGCSLLSMIFLMANKS